jgi:hypothetical protein
MERESGNFANKKHDWNLIDTMRPMIRSDMAEAKLEETNQTTMADRRGLSCDRLNVEVEDCQWWRR